VTLLCDHAVLPVGGRCRGLVYACRCARKDGIERMMSPGNDDVVNQTSALSLRSAMQNKRLIDRAEMNF
jgi:hypothetical protein